MSLRCTNKLIPPDPSESVRLMISDLQSLIIRVGVIYHGEDELVVLSIREWGGTGHIGEHSDISNKGGGRVEVTYSTSTCDSNCVTSAL